MNFNLTLMITKMLNDQKPSKEELLELQKSQDKISKFVTDRSFTNKKDLKYIKTVLFWFQTPNCHI